MSVRMIIEVLSKMIGLHENLNKLATQKTEIIKKGDVPALQSLLKDENREVKDIRQAEMLLQQQTVLFLKQNEVEIDTPVLSKVIDLAEEEEKQVLRALRKSLEAEIQELKKKNQLNQDLLAQSLQFVQMSLDLLQPDLENYNYDPSEKGPSNLQKPNHSLFDSKA